jgi:hypothetical protein
MLEAPPVPASSPAQIEARANGTTGNLITFPFRMETMSIGASANLEGSRESGASTTLRVKSLRRHEIPRIVISGREGQKSHTISSGIPDIDNICKFQIRSTDQGVRVHLRYRDDAGNRTSPYACYLTPGQWSSVKRGDYQGLVEVIAGKTADRRDISKETLSTLMCRIRGIQNKLEERERERLERH